MNPNTDDSNNFGGPKKTKPGTPPPSVQATAINPVEFFPGQSGGPKLAHTGRSIPIGSMLGKYKITAVLGHGGMGNVYAAEDPLIKRKVAIKVLPPEMAQDPSLIQRLLSEAQAAGKLNHPNVVTMHDLDHSDGTYYIVMELVTGGSMQDYLTRKGAPGWRAATRLIGEACKALVVAHEAGLVHRDIKPANLMLTADGHVKVADFGLAKAESSDTTMRTQAGVILGTPAFMSPEQCRGDKVDHRTDIYSLGCTYYALLTGKPPFEAASSIQMMFAHCSAPIPDPCNLNADTPQACADILRKALAKDPNERYATAKDMLGDIRALLGGQTIAGSGISNTAAMAALAENAAQAEPLLPPVAMPRARRAKAPPIWMLATAGVGLLALIASIVCIVLLTRSKQDTLATPPDQQTSPTLTAITPATITPPKPVVQTPPIVVPATTIAPIVMTPATVPATQIAIKPVPPPATAPVVATTAPVVVTTAPAVAVTPAVATAPATAPVAVAPPPPPLPPSLINSIGQVMVLIHPGKFIMGDAALSDAPPHPVRIKKTFYMGIYEVSQGEMKKVMGNEMPATRPIPDELPAAFATWANATEFCRLLSARPEEKAAGHTYRLPTEAEWEYCCRAGTTTKFSFGDALPQADANYGKKIDLAAPRTPRPPPNGPNGGRPPGPPNGPNGGAPNQDGELPPPPDGQQQQQQHPLEPRGIYPANPWGLYDMHGSVWEWCSDFYAVNTYKMDDLIDPQGPKTGIIHVARGGCWSSSALQCSSAFRNGKADPNMREPSYGFRVVCEVHQ